MMGKAKTQRTEALHQAARRYVLAKQAQQAIAQHNLDKLVAQGVIMTEPTGNPEIYDYDPEYKHRGASGKALPPKGAG